MPIPESRDAAQVQAYNVLKDVDHLRRQLLDVARLTIPSVVTGIATCAATARALNAVHEGLISEAYITDWEADVQTAAEFLGPAQAMIDGLKAKLGVG